MDKFIGPTPELNSLINLPETFQHVLSLRLWSLNRTFCPNDCRFRRHKHIYFEIMIPLRGSYRCLLDDETIECAPGECVFIQPGDMHEDLYEKGLEFLGVIFHLQDFGANRWRGLVLRDKLPLKERVLKISDERPSRIVDLIRSSSPSEACEPLSVFALEGLSEALFWSLAKKIPQNELSKEFLKCLGEDEFRLKASSFFSSQAPGEALNLEKMASALGVSRRALSYKFNEVFGASPAKAFASWRIIKAASVLESGASVKDAARETGFADQFHFSKVFKREMGFSPSKLGAKER